MWGPDNSDCTIDQDGFLCATVYVYAGEGPNGGVLLQKICGCQESGLPILRKLCDVGVDLTALTYTFRR
jgi:hypothetical protein